MKKLLAIMLAMVLVLVQVVVPVFAEEDILDDPYKGVKIESITVEATYPLYENYNGSVMECEKCENGEYFHYNIASAVPVFTVVYEDGREEYGDESVLTGEVEIFDDQDIAHWELGAHDVLAYYRGVECKFEVEVIENPVASLSVSASKPLKQGWDTYVLSYFDDEDNEIFYDYYDVEDAGLVYTITLKDGSEIVGTNEEIYEITGYFVDEYSNQAVTPFVIGKNTVNFEFLGAEATCELELIANPYKGIELSGETELILTFIGVDEKDTYTTKIVDMYVLDEGLGSLDCIFYTEDGEVYEGQYNCYYDEVVGNAYNYLVSVKINEYYSNIIELNAWFMVRVSLEAVLLASTVYVDSSFLLTGELFDGYDITSEDKSIDDLVALAIYLGAEEITDMDEQFAYITCTAEAVEEYIAVLFGLEADVTQSKFYDSETKTLTVMIPLELGVYYETKAMLFEGEQWTLYSDIYNYDGEKVGELAVSLSIDGIITSIEYTDMKPKLGDANGDFKVTSVDARYILQYIAELRTEDEVNLEYMDVNGDGEITSVDARWVLQAVAELRVLE